MFMTRMKAIRTALEPTTPTKSLKWPSRESAAEDGLKKDSFFNEKNRLLILDPGRYVLFKGRWYVPGVTVRPVFEFWNYKSLSLVEPEASPSLVEPQVCSLLSKNLHYMAAGLDGLAAYQALKSNKDRALVAADLAALPIGPAAPAPANVTTKQKIKEFLRKRNVQTRLLSLQEFLTCLDLEGCVDNLQGKRLEDLVTLSVEEMAALGIRQDHIVQIKNGINYVLDLHNKNFDVFAPVANAA